MRMNRRSAALLFTGAFLLRPETSRSAEPSTNTPARVPGTPLALPKDIVWETNNEDPFIGSPQAIRGGTLNVSLGAYPLTFRLMGPDSNDFFAGWNRAFTMGYSLVGMHPVTDNFIPNMATHWSIQSDQKTIYFKLDPDARFSDGVPVSADDYVFTWKMMQSRFIVDPFYNTYVQQYLQSVDKIDDYTLRIVGTRPSWRPLYDYSLWPTPQHATHLDKDWVMRTNNQWQVAVGPYIVSAVERGQSVTFKRIANWWGDKKRYNIGQYNFDEIRLWVVPPERELDYVRSGQLDMMAEGQVENWHEAYTFPAITNGWLRRARVFVDMPQGISGLQMNMGAPIFQDVNFRVAMQYLVNFDRLNRNLWFDDYYRINSFFEGTEFANPNVKAYPFDPIKAEEYLRRAGYRRPAAASAQGAWAKLRNAVTGIIFTRSDTDDILVNRNGEKASFTLVYESEAWEHNLTVMQQDYRRAGVDMRLQLLEPGAQFERLLERKYEMGLLAMTSGLYPDPRQYLGTEFKKTNNNNDFWGFGTAEVDGLIKIYEQSLNPHARRQALWRMDRIIHDAAFYIPMRMAPYIRLVYWDYMQFPDFYLPKRTQQYSDWMVYWIDPEKKKALAEAMRTGNAYPVDKDIDRDYYGVRKKFQ
jgi:microcin C transport system substrate-binding protein